MSAQISLTQIGRHPRLVPVFLRDDWITRRAQDWGKQPQRCCDYWAIGICAFELLFKKYPIQESDPQTVLSHINKKELFNNAERIATSADMKSLISSLVCSAEIRLTYDRLVLHKLFRDMDMTSLRRKTPPYIPDLKGPDDSSYFGDIEVLQRGTRVENLRQRQFTGRNLAFIGYSFIPYSDEETVATTHPVTTDAAKFDRRVKQIEKLQQRVIRMEMILQKYNSLKLQHKQTLGQLESSEETRAIIERQLAETQTETSAINRRLEMEKKDRGDLEERAIDLVKCAKSKWMVEESTRTAQFRTVINKLELEVKTLRESNETIDMKNRHLTMNTLAYDRELNRLRTMQETYENNKQHVCTEKRLTLDCLRAQLQIVTSDSDRRIEDLRSELSRAWINANTSKQQYTDISAQNDELQQELKNNEEEIKNLRSELTERGTEVLQLKSTIEYMEVDRAAQASSNSFLDTMLEVTRERCTNLESTIATLEEVIRCDQEQYAELRAVFNYQIDGNDKTISDATKMFADQRNKDMLHATEKINNLEHNVLALNKQLLESCNLNETFQAKIVNLEEVVERLEQGATREAVVTAREHVFQDQIRRQENQIKELHEANTRKVEELRSAHTDLWRKDRLIRKSQVDQRNLTREVAESKDTISQLTKKVKELEEQQIENAKKLTESEISSRLNWKKYYDTEQQAQEFYSRNEVLTSNVTGLKGKIERLQKDKAALRNVSDKRQAIEDELRRKLEEATASVLRYSRNETKYEQQIAGFQCEIQVLTAELNSTRTAYRALRESSVVVEQQVEGYDNLVLTLKNKQTELMDQIRELNNEVLQLDNQVNAASTESQHKSSALLQAHHTKANLEQQIQMLKLGKEQQRKEIDKLKRLTSELLASLAAAERERDLANASVLTLTDSMTNLRSNIRLLQEESSERLTTIMHARENNMMLTEQKSDIQVENACLNETVKNLLEERHQKEEYNNMRALKFKERIQQMEKVADLLQQMLQEESKKKTPLSTKLFGHKREPTQPLILTYRELRSMLLEERSENAQLKAQVMSLGGIPLSNTPEVHVESAQTRQARASLDACLSTNRPMFAAISSSSDEDAIEKVPLPPLPPPSMAQRPAMPVMVHRPAMPVMAHRPAKPVLVQKTAPLMMVQKVVPPPMTQRPPIPVIVQKADPPVIVQKAAPSPTAQQPAAQSTTKRPASPPPAQRPASPPMTQGPSTSQMSRGNAHRGGRGRKSNRQNGKRR